MELTIALISLVGSIIVNVVQIIKAKSENRKLDSESTSLLIETALKLNKQEVDTLRSLYLDLESRYKTLLQELQNCEDKLKANDKKDP